MKAYFTLICLFFLLGSSSLEAATFTWVGGDGDWSDADNWDCDCSRSYPGDNPLFTDIAEFSAGGAAAAVYMNITQLRLGGLIMHNPNVSLEEGSFNSALTILGTMTWTAGSIDVDITINSSGECKIIKLFVPYDKTLIGTLTNKGTISQTTNLTLASGATLYNENIHNYGLNAGLTIELGAKYRNETGSKFTTSEDGGVMHGAGEFINYGVFKFPANNAGGGLSIYPDFHNYFEYKQVTGDRSVFFEGKLINHPGGAFFLGESSDIYFRGDGELNGTMNGSGQLIFESDFIVWASPDSRFNLRIQGESYVSWRALFRTHKFTLDASNGGIYGIHNIEVSNEFHFVDGTLGNRVTVLNGAECIINEDGTGLPKLSSVLFNSGEIRQEGPLTIESEGRIENNKEYHQEGPLTIKLGGGVINNKDYHLRNGIDLIIRSDAFYENNDNFFLVPGVFPGVVSGGGSFRNNGLVKRPSSPFPLGSFTFQSKFTNEGTFDFSSGRDLTFTDYFSNGDGGDVILNNNAVLEVHNGGLKLGSILTGANKLVMTGTFEVNTAPTNQLELDFEATEETDDITWNIDYTTDKVTLQNNDGFLTGSGALYVNNSFDFNRGKLDLPLRVKEGAVCTINTPEDKSIHKLLELRGNSIQLDGALRLASTGSILNEGEFEWNGGDINMPSPASIFRNNGTFKITDDVRFTSNSQGLFINDATFRITGETQTTRIYPDFQNHGVFQQLNNGTTRFENDCTNTGRIEGVGTIRFPPDFNHSGELSPGLSIGVLNMNQLDLTTAGTTFIELAGNDGAGAANGNDQIPVIGDATLGGTLDVSFLNGFQPEGNDEFVIMTCSSCSGSFDNIISPPGNDFEVDLSTLGQVILRVAGFLPIELLDFRAKTKGAQVILDWQTATEQNNRGFDIQRSEEGRDWGTIGFVNGGGTTIEPQTYSFEDLPGRNGTYHYRLRQIDTDGQFTLSPIRSVHLNSTESLLHVFPNPVKNDVTIEFNSSWKGAIQIRIINALGQEVFFHPTIKSSDDFMHEMNLSKLPNGSYQILISNLDQLITQSFVKVDY